MSNLFKKSALYYDLSEFEKFKMFIDDLENKDIKEIRLRKSDAFYNLSLKLINDAWVFRQFTDEEEFSGEDRSHYFKVGEGKFVRTSTRMKFEAVKEALFYIKNGYTVEIS